MSGSANTIVVYAQNSSMRRVVCNNLKHFGGWAALYTFTTLAGGVAGTAVPNYFNVGYFAQGARSFGGNTNVSHMKGSGILTTREKAVPNIVPNGTYTYQNDDVTTVMTMGGFAEGGRFTSTRGSAARCYFNAYVQFKYFFTSNPTPSMPVGFCLSATGSWRESRDGNYVRVRGTGIKSYRFDSGGVIKFTAIKASALSYLTASGRVVSATGTIELWDVTIDCNAQTYNAVNTYRVAPLVGGSVRYGAIALVPPKSYAFPVSTGDADASQAKYTENNTAVPFFDQLIRDTSTFMSKKRLRGGVAMMALEQYRAINSNNIENIAQLRELRKLLPVDAALSLFEAASRGKVRGAAYFTKAMSQLYLWYRYVFKPSIKDFKQWRALITESQTIFSKCDQPRHLRASSQYTEEFGGNTFVIRDTERITVSPYSDNGWLRALYIGMEPGLGQAWDLIPFSFVMDWFIPVAGTLRAMDWFMYQSLLGIRYRVLGHKVTATLTYAGYTGSVELSWYTRVVTSSWPDFVERVPLPRSLPLSNWGLAAAALVISR